MKYIFLFIFLFYLFIFFIIIFRYAIAYLRTGTYAPAFNIFEDDEFSRSRQGLAAKRKSLVQSGFGNKPNANRKLTEEEQEKLFETRQ